MRPPSQPAVGRLELERKKAAMSPRLGWHYGPHWGYCHSEVEIDRDKVTEAAKTLLAKVHLGGAWIDPHGA